MDAILEIIFLIAFNALMFWQAEERKFLWVLGAVGNIILGLNYAAGSVQYSAVWMIGFLVTILGFYDLTVFAMWAIGNYRKKNKAPISKKEE
jgi:hypothetical protein